jgi:hypothetical protein
MSYQAGGCSPSTVTNHPAADRVVGHWAQSEHIFISGFDDLTTRQPTLALHRFRRREGFRNWSRQSIE